MTIFISQAWWPACTWHCFGHECLYACVCVCVSTLGMGDNKNSMLQYIVIVRNYHDNRYYHDNILAYSDSITTTKIVNIGQNLNAFNTPFTLLTNPGTARDGSE